MFYEYEIEVIKRNLGLQGLDIDIRFVQPRKTWGAIHRFDEKCKQHFIEVNYDIVGEDLINTLAHELRHAWQHYVGKLKNVKERSAIWEGKKYIKVPSRMIMGNRYEEYMQLPWEIDAREYAEYAVNELFNGRRVLISQVGNVKFYKLKV